MFISHGDPRNWRFTKLQLYHTKMDANDITIEYFDDYFQRDAAHEFLLHSSTSAITQPAVQPSIHRYAFNRACNWVVHLELNTNHNYQNSRFRTSRIFWPSIANPPSLLNKWSFWLRLQSAFYYRKPWLDNMIEVLLKKARYKEDNWDTSSAFFWADNAASAVWALDVFIHDLTDSIAVLFVLNCVLPPSLRGVLSRLLY